MKTLDQLLSTKIDTIYKEELQKVLDFTNWTEDNRDEKYNLILEVGNTVSLQAEKLVRELVEKKIEGQSLFYWMAVDNSIAGVIQLLLQLRDELDVSIDGKITADGVNSLPLDYNWLNVKIRELYKQKHEISLKIDAVVNNPGTVSQL